MLAGEGGFKSRKGLGFKWSRFPSTAWGIYKYKLYGKESVAPNFVQQRQANPFRRFVRFMAGRAGSVSSSPSRQGSAGRGALYKIPTEHAKINVN